MKIMTGQKDSNNAFHDKHVYMIHCLYCSSLMSSRGMKAVLLADTNTELFSTDYATNGSLGAVGDGYTTEHCKCQIQDVACLACGNVVGYRVSLPCLSCLRSCNNGHFWMFYSDSVFGVERLHDTQEGVEVDVWADLFGMCNNTYQPMQLEECIR